MKSLNSLLLILQLCISAYISNVNAQQYCIPPKFLSGPYTGITNIKVGTINSTTANNDGYADYTGSAGVCNLTRGGTVNFTITCYYDPGMVSFFTGNLNLRVWIDWNADFDFNDAGETAVSNTVNCKGVTSANPNVTATYTITVPANAVSGNTRMRVYEDICLLTVMKNPLPADIIRG